MTASGRVQGVGFRWAVMARAVELGDIYGRVWNNDDGTVTILAQSDNADKMAQFIHDIRQGPSRFAKVTYLDVTLTSFDDFKDFKVK
ncbi:acylphosphatase [Streptococcus rupicaprae]